MFRFHLSRLDFNSRLKRSRETVFLSALCCCCMVRSLREPRKLLKLLGRKVHKAGTKVQHKKNWESRRLLRYEWSRWERRAPWMDLLHSPLLASSSAPKFLDLFVSVRPAERQSNGSNLWPFRDWSFNLPASGFLLSRSSLCDRACDRPFLLPSSTCTTATSSPANSCHLSASRFPRIISRFPTNAWLRWSPRFSWHSRRLPKAFLFRFSTSGTRYHVWLC